MVKAVYIHIPFCKNICSYCDFCKVFYNEKQVDKYLQSLEKEIASNYKNEKIETIYIGGGTPSSLSIEQLQSLFKILEKIDKTNLKEFTIEVNAEDITQEKLELFKEKGINRISIGHQTKNPKYIKQLGRKTYLTKEQMLLVKKYFKNINIDMMYGFNNQKTSEFVEELEYIISLNPTHISTYSLILEEHTKLYINNYQRLDDNKDASFYKILQEKLEQAGFKQYEISNFSKKGFSSKHNLTYWNNEEYYGFGLGASGYINNIRYTNTRNINKYFSGNYIHEIERIDKTNDMIYHMILGLRKTSGVSKSEFLEKFGCNIEQIFDIIDIMKQGLIEDKDGYIKIPKKYLYQENQILIHFLEVVNEKREV